MNVRHGLVVLLALVTASVGLAAAPASAADDQATLLVAPEGGGIIRSGDDLAVDVTVTNSGSTALPAGALAFAVDEAPVASSTTLLSQLAEPTSGFLGFLTSTTAKVPALDAGQSRSVRATIRDTDSTLRSLIASGNGTRLLYVRYRAGTAPTAAGTVKKSVVTYVAPGFTGKVGFGTVIAVTAPAGSTGLVDTDAQAELTRPGGAWDAGLHAARRSPSAAIALDPAVLASIRLAGAAAPASATDFLDGLEALPNQFLRLPYADADITLERAASPGSVHNPPSSFSAASVVSATSPGATPTPQPTPTGGQDRSTAYADLTKWQWSDQQVAWPVPGTASAADVAGLGGAGEAVLLASSDLQDSPARRAAGPLARVGNTRVLVADTTVSALLASATARSTQGDAALAELTGLLATDAVTGETPALLGVARRPADADGLGRVIDLIERQPWVSGRSLAELATQPTSASVKLAKTRVPPARIETARSLLAAERDVQNLGRAVTQDAATITGPPRLALLGLLSAQWRGDDAGWAAAASETAKSFGDLAGRVSLVRGDDANAIGTDGHLQVTVENRLDRPVKVVIRAAVSNGRLQFGGDGVTVAVPADARNVGRLLFRTITNGSTDVTLTLETPDGTRIGTSVVRPVTVRAGFDTIIAIVLLSALGLLLALGVYRNVRRRRQPRAAAAAAA